MRAIGLMSGTSMDGIDVALIETDGEQVTRFGPSAIHSYNEYEARRAAPGDGGGARAAGARRAPRRDRAGRAGGDDAACRRRQHVPRRQRDRPPRHRCGRVSRPDHPAPAEGAPDGPARRRRGARARASAFRWSTISAPPTSRPAGRARRWFRSITRRLRRRSTRPHPIAVLNLGGVANITFIDGTDPIACDTGPANALIDDFMRARNWRAARRGRTRRRGRARRRGGDRAAAAAPVLRAAGAEIARPQRLPPMGRGACRRLRKRAPRMAPRR